MFYQRLGSNTNTLEKPMQSHPDDPEPKAHVKWVQIQDYAHKRTDIEKIWWELVEIEKSRETRVKSIKIKIDNL